MGQTGSLSEWGSWREAWTSSLMALEVRRCFDRLRYEQELDDETCAGLNHRLDLVEAAVYIVELTRTVLERAALPMGRPVKTLDSIHLASALMVREREGKGLVFATHDQQQARVAGALGFACIGT